MDLTLLKASMRPFEILIRQNKWILIPTEFNTSRKRGSTTLMRGGREDLAKRRRTPAKILRPLQH